MRSTSLSSPPTALGAESGSGAEIPKAWRLLRHFGDAPGLQMARDEALLDLGGAVPVLRLYTWTPDALSLGYFQAISDVPEAERASQVVRRWTGGGAIHHAAELTFAIVAPLDHPLYRGPISHSYERVHAVLIAALGTLGIEANLKCNLPDPAAQLRSDNPTSGMCFHKSTAQDIVWDDAKGIGSAQRRRAGRVLHHGSIKLGTTPLEGPIATVGLSLQSMETALLAAFEAKLGVSWIQDDLTAPEAKQASKRAPFFTSPAFLAARAAR